MDENRWRNRESAGPENIGRSGQVDARHRGVKLPPGMTPACLDDLAALLNRHCRGDTDDLDSEAAAKVFKCVMRHL
jgi:hypothetical protein